MIPKQKYRLKFHLMPPKGWMNDPNGLCFFQGKYHVFYQYAPSGPCGYERFWGHYSSTDLLHWTDNGIAIRSDCSWDRNGAFSGCAFTEDGIMELFYTGNVEEEGDYDYIYEGRGANVICLQSGDGFHFGEKKLLLTNQDYPKEYTCHVRDPKVWKEGTSYHMVLGGRKKNDKGAILHYISEDKRNWTLKEELSLADAFGFMWECPDYFELDGHKVLICCPQGVIREEYRYQNPHQAGFWLLSEEQFTSEAFTELDKGFDFYAPQTFLAPDGRRILYGWGGVSEMDLEYGNAPIIKEGWQHSLTVPRVLSIKENTLYQWPVKELEALRYDMQLLNDGEYCIADNAFDLELTFSGRKESAKIIKIQLGEDILLRFMNGIFSLLFLNDSGCGRRERKARIGEVSNLRLLKDVSMLEIYINDGHYVFTTRYFPRNTEETMLSVSGCETCKLWRMKAMDVEYLTHE